MPRQKLNEKEKTDIARRVKKEEREMLVDWNQILDEEKSFNLQIRIPMSLKRALDRKRGSLPRSTFACEILRRFVMAEEPEDQTEE